MSEFEAITEPNELRARRKELLKRINDMLVEGKLNEYGSADSFQDHEDWQKEIKHIEEELKAQNESIE